ncbi:uncharacterized protein Nmag_2731 [Natrialba magadii ATCC 43099]|uniref:Ig-like domain-containing protein n=1 Tax=Natrialba magadii (strain ATCC 43099 / DSM 3394 / CCM 3739 / CIP 104546 / IAM 13178 / JCM 8861 / NBRC 102185 / NCIMB 2190 / MS3) TaxID=547559 RepID=D3SZM7_NATMM|nr:hypothetical protein [Natrialba magadii]ADD06287.1 uncharacterized protein Nmag_2731 [Natrialba magadii ATCC 43099]ELY31276.1 hypothetical protein C500_06731 [Natrialba magadii ATCC 43099]
MIDRRTSLVAVLGSILAISGCLERISNGDTEGVRILSIRIFNEDETDHDVTVAVVDDDGAETYTATQPIEAENMTTLENPVDDPGNYTLKVTINDESVEHSISHNLDPRDKCARATIRLVKTDQIHFDATGYTEC